MVCAIMGLCQSSKLFLEACQTLDYRVIERLLNEGHNVNQVTTDSQRHRPDLGCLHLCLNGSGKHYHKDRQRCLDILLRHGADPNQRNQRGETPVMVAELNNDTVSMRRLIAAGCDIKKMNYNGKTALFTAISHERFLNASILLCAGADINEMKGYLLHAAKHGKVNTLRFLLKAGCDVNYRCPERGATALHHSILSALQVPDVLQLLLDHGADIDIMDNIGSRPIHWALIVKDKSAVKVLMAQDANLNTSYISSESIFDYVYSLGLIGHMEACGYVVRRVKKRLVFENIPSLKSLCRKTIRREIGTPVNVKVSSLPLPSSHKRYIQLLDII